MRLFLCSWAASICVEPSEREVKTYHTSPHTSHPSHTSAQIVTYVKEIEVSHWGNIYVEEKYEIKNAGARHSGSFSRLKYAHSYNGKANSFRVSEGVCVSVMVR